MELQYRRNKILDLTTVLRDSESEASSTISLKAQTKSFYKKRRRKSLNPGITRDHQSYTSLRNKADEL